MVSWIGLVLSTYGEYLMLSPLSIHHLLIFVHRCWQMRPTSVLLLRREPLFSPYILVQLYGKAYGIDLEKYINN